MKSIVDTTVLLPHVVADKVISEAQALLGDKHIIQDVRELANKLADRAERIWQRNDRFRRQLRGPQGREYLYMFMRHWLAAEFYRTPIGEALPQSFKLGVYDGR